jgi:hypothetical protein
MMKFDFLSKVIAMKIIIFITFIFVIKSSDGKYDYEGDSYDMPHVPSSTHLPRKQSIVYGRSTPFVGIRLQEVHNISNHKNETSAGGQVLEGYSLANISIRRQALLNATNSRLRDLEKAALELEAERTRVAFESHQQDYELQELEEEQEREREQRAREDQERAREEQERRDREREQRAREEEAERKLNEWLSTGEAVNATSNLSIIVVTQSWNVSDSEENDTHDRVTTISEEMTDSYTTEKMKTYDQEMKESENEVNEDMERLDFLVYDTAKATYEIAQNKTVLVDCMMLHNNTIISVKSVDMVVRKIADIYDRLSDIHGCNVDIYKELPKTDMVMIINRTLEAVYAAFNLAHQAKVLVKKDFARLMWSVQESRFPSCPMLADDIDSLRISLTLYKEYSYRVLRMTPMLLKDRCEFDFLNHILEDMKWPTTTVRYVHQPKVVVKEQERVSYSWFLYVMLVCFMSALCGFLLAAGVYMWLSRGSRIVSINDATGRAVLTRRSYHTHTGKDCACWVGADRKRKSETQLEFDRQKIKDGIVKIGEVVPDDQLVPPPPIVAGGAALNSPSCSRTLRRRVEQTDGGSGTVFNFLDVVDGEPDVTGRKNSCKYNFVFIHELNFYKYFL